MSKFLKNILILSLILGLVFPRTLLAQPIQDDQTANVQDTSPKEDMITVTVDGKEVQMTEDEYKKHLEELEEEKFLAAVRRERHKDLEDLTTAYVLADFESGKILYEHNIDEVVALASTSKILTIYVVMDQIKAGHISMDDTVTIDKEVASLGGSTYDLKEGEQVPVSKLIVASMVVSGNDATRALAKHVAGTEDNFTQMMTAKLEDLGIEQYQIINASGFPDYMQNKQNMMSTRDLLKLTRYFLKDYPEVLSMTSIQKIVEEDRNYEEDNTNPILGDVPGVDGLKTGYTGMAGRCMVATGKKTGVFDNTEDIRFIGITMGSASDAQRYVAIKRIMEDGLKNYEKRIIVDLEEPVETVEGIGTDPEEIKVYAKETASIAIKKDQPIDRHIEIDQIRPPRQAGETVGRAVYSLDGQEILNTDLIIKEDINDPSFLGQIARIYNNGFRRLANIFNYSLDKDKNQSAQAY